MYLSCLLVEDDIRHLFHMNQTVCLPSSLLTLLRAFQFPRRLGTCARGPAVHLVPRFLSHPFCSSQSYLGRQTHLAAATLATAPSGISVSSSCSGTRSGTSDVMVKKEVRNQLVGMCMWCAVEVVLRCSETCCGKDACSRSEFIV